MPSPIELPEASLKPVLDPGFRPPVLANRCFLDRAAEAGGPIVGLAIESCSGRVYTHETRIFPADHPQAASNCHYAERLLKFLLRQRGGWKVAISGSDQLATELAAIYSSQGARAFDAEFWGILIHQRPFTIVATDAAPPPREAATSADRIDRDWSGWRIGFDLGASDRKVAAVLNGKLALKPDGTPVLSEEFIWDPKPQTNPDWHYAQIMEILDKARQAILAVDPTAKIHGIGGSAAGIYVDGQVRVASLFRGVHPRARFEAEVAPLFRRIQKAWDNIPFRIENDGDVTALAGAIALGEGAILGLSMGSSLAAGYVDADQQIRGWMNELAFAPVDYQPGAAADEWSGDCGVGANYFSQQAVARLIPKAGLEPEMAGIPAEAIPKRLVRVQERMAAGDDRAAAIYQTIGRYFGYTVAHYCDFYHPVRHIEVLGRVMTGDGGQLILEEARQVLDREFPKLATEIAFYEPDEREKRHGQAAAAAYLPATSTDNRDET